MKHSEHTTGAAADKGPAHQADSAIALLIVRGLLRAALLAPLQDVPAAQVLERACAPGRMLLKSVDVFIDHMA